LNVLDYQNANSTIYESILTKNNNELRKSWMNEFLENFYIYSYLNKTSEKNPWFTISCIYNIPDNLFCSITLVNSKTLFEIYNHISCLYYEKLFITLGNYVSDFFLMGYIFNRCYLKSNFTKVKNIFKNFDYLSFSREDIACELFNIMYIYNDVNSPISFTIGPTIINVDNEFKYMYYGLKFNFDIVCNTNINIFSSHFIVNDNKKLKNTKYLTVINLWINNRVSIIFLRYLNKEKKDEIKNGLDFIIDPLAILSDCFIKIWQFNNKISDLVGFLVYIKFPQYEFNFMLWFSIYFFVIIISINNKKQLSIAIVLNNNPLSESNKLTNVSLFANHDVDISGHK
jgi:hypothetical protein